MKKVTFFRCIITQSDTLTIVLEMDSFPLFNLDEEKVK